MIIYNGQENIIYCKRGNYGFRYTRFTNTQNLPFIEFVAKSTCFANLRNKSELITKIGL